MGWLSNFQLDIAYVNGPAIPVHDSRIGILPVKKQIDFKKSIE